MKRSAGFLLSSVCILFMLPLTSSAQTASTAPSQVPVPSEFATARTVFLAPAGNSGPLSSVFSTALVYSDTYQMLSSLGHYKVVTTPAEADIAMEVSVAPIAIGTAGSLQLVVRDAKTSTLLWRVDAALNSDFNAKHAEIFLKAAETRLSTQLNSLINGTIPDPTAK